jgi:lipopolysaccharide export system permease protein
MVVFFGFMVLALCIDMADLFAQTPQHPIPANIVIGMSLLKIADIGQHVMPFAILLGAIAIFFRQSKSYELVATRAAGVSAWQFLTPPLAVAVLLGLFTMMVYNPVAALFLAQYELLDAKYIQNKDSQLAISRNGLWLRQGDAEHQSVIHALKPSEQGTHLEDVIVFLYQGVDQVAGRIDARSAELGEQSWQLADAWVSDATGRPVFHKTYDLPTDLTPSRIQESFASPDTVSFWDLPGFIENAESAGFSATRHRLYWYTLASLPLLFAAMVFMAASFSLRLARLGRVTILVLAGAFSGFAVYFLGNLTAALGQSGTLPVPLAAVTPALVAILLGMTLLFHHEDG